MENTNIKDMLAQLALADAVSKAVGEMTSTKSSDNLRAHVDSALLDLYESTGASKMQVEVNGAEVGTFSLTFTRPVDETVIVCRDQRKLVEWLRSTDEGKDTLDAVIGKAIGDVLKAAKGYGFLPDGCAMEQVCEPKRVKGSMLKVDKLKVAQAMGKQLPSAVAGMLGTGEVE